MRLCFLARRFYPEVGGVEKHVMEIGKRLVKKGHKVIVIAELEKIRIIPIITRLQIVLDSWVKSKESKFSGLTQARTTGLRNSGFGNNCGN